MGIIVSVPCSEAVSALVRSCECIRNRANHRHLLFGFVVAHRSRYDRRGLAKEIVGELKDRKIYEHTRRIAETQTSLSRIRRARHRLLVQNGFNLVRSPLDTKSIGKLNP